MTVDSQAPPRSLRDLLTSEHAEVERLLLDLLGAYESDDREIATAAYRVAEARLRAHFVLEEEQLFPELAQVEPAETNALRAEHAALRRRLDDMGIGVELHQIRSGAIRELVEDLRAHAARENGLLYRWVDRAFSDPTRRSSLETHFAHGRSPAHPEAS